MKQIDADTALKDASFRTAKETSADGRLEGGKTTEESLDRPPLPSMAVLPPPRESPDMIVRTTTSKDESAGEVSNVTDPSLEVMNHQPNHRRTVSWNANVKNGEKDKNGDSPSQALKKGITVVDLREAKTLESEAETSMMKALEQRAEEEKLQGITTGSRLFSHIPDESIESLQVGSQDMSEHRSKQSASPKSHRRKQSKAPKNETLETTLFGLTNAMKEMHKKHEHTAKNVPDHHRLPHEAHEEAFESLSLDDDEPMSNADAMVRHAALLFQNPLRKKKLQQQGMDDSEENIPLKTSTHSHRSRLSVASGMSSGGKHLDGVPEEVEYSSEDSDPELGENQTESSSDDENVPSHKKQRKPSGIIRRMRSGMRRGARKTKSDWTAFRDYLQPKKATLWTRIKMALLLVVIPTLCLSAVLYHAFDNPDLGREGASISWFVLFLLRQAVCGSLALASQSFVIDFLTLRMKWTVRVFGPLATLVLVQSKGYPFIMMAWAVYDLALLSGRHVFAKHW